MLRYNMLQAMHALHVWSLSPCKVSTFNHNLPSNQSLLWVIMATH